MKCRKCKDITEIGGAAITPYTCEKCGNTFMYMLTKTPKVCSDCSKKYHVCESCGTILYTDEIEESISKGEDIKGLSTSKLLLYIATGEISDVDFKKIQRYYEKK